MFPDINKEKFALFGNTCGLVYEGIVLYKWDIESAIICGLQNRNLTSTEWD